MGKIFLLAILAGAIYGGYGIYSHIHGMTHPKPVVLPSVASEGKDSGPPIKEPPARSSSQEIDHAHEKEPLPVLSSNHAWIQIEAWGIIGRGEPLPDGSTLESWDKWAVVVRTVSGGLEKRRVRTALEAMSKIVPAVAAGGMPAVPEGPNK